MDRKTVFYPVLGVQGGRILPMDTRSAEARAFARRQAERLERMEHQKLIDGLLDWQDRQDAILKARWS